MELSREEFILHLELVHEGITGITTRIGVLERDVAVLMDRSESTHNAATAQAKLTAGRWGMLLAGLGAAVELVHQWWGK